MPRYTLCPYYKDENKKSISCEDAIRRFDALNSKWSWMDKYCDKNWQDCPYANHLITMCNAMGYDIIIKPKYEVYKKAKYHK